MEPISLREVPGGDAPPAIMVEAHLHEEKCQVGMPLPRHYVEPISMRRSARWGCPYPAGTTFEAHLYDEKCQVGMPHWDPPVLVLTCLLA